MLRKHALDAFKCFCFSDINAYLNLPPTLRIQNLSVCDAKENIVLLPSIVSSNF